MSESVTIASLVDAEVGAVWGSKAYLLPPRVLLVQAMSGQLASHNTYANIVHNKANIDYCIEQFSFISSRIKCIKLMTGNV